MAKVNLIVAKKVSKSGNPYLTASIKCGQFSKRDYFFININNAQCLTGLSAKQIEEAETGVLFDKDLEV